MDTACAICDKQDKRCWSSLVAVVLAVHLLLFLWTNPTSAYVWRCHSPHGDFWTSAPKESDDCTEYDSIYNPDAAPPMAKQRTAMEFTTPERGTKDKVLFTQQELDQMLAPVALYPDSLLSQILMASTYPLEIVEAARWVKAHSTLQGDQAVKATDQYNWEPSVKSLVAFPNVLAMMDEKLDWTERLGDAFLSQQPDVMDTVQNLRQRASTNGTLQSTDQVRIDQEGQNISITSPTRKWCTCPTTIPRSSMAPGGGRPIRRCSGDRGPATSRVPARASGTCGAPASRWEPVSSSAPSTGRIDRSPW